VLRQLVDWRAKDEKLVQAVKKRSSQTVRRLIGGKVPAQPDKLDPNRGSTACVSNKLSPRGAARRYAPSPLMAVRLAVDLRPSADGSAVRKSLVAGQLQAASEPIA